MFNEYHEFDLAEALHFWLQDNWEGKSDPLYESYCVLTAPGMFQPGTYLKFDDLNDSAREAYESLTRENYREALERVLNYETTG